MEPGTQYQAPEIMMHLTLEKLCELWEKTKNLTNPEAPIVRGWLMDAIRKRNTLGFDAWINQEAPENKDLRYFVSLNEMCLTCACLNKSCQGTTNKAWTGCIHQKKISFETRPEGYEARKENT